MELDNNELSRKLDVTDAGGGECGSGIGSDGTGGGAEVDSGSVVCMSTVRTSVSSLASVH